MRTQVSSSVFMLFLALSLNPNLVRADAPAQSGTERSEEVVTEEVVLMDSISDLAIQQNLDSVYEYDSCGYYSCYSNGYCCNSCYCYYSGGSYWGGSGSWDYGHHGGHDHHGGHNNHGGGHGGRRN